MSEGEGGVFEGEGTGESLLAILDELTALVEGAKAMPMTASALLNRAEVLELISSARQVLPEQLAQAEQVRADAEGILARARERAEELLDGERVVREANRRAEQIIHEAQERADALARDADDYCDRRLAEFEVDLERISTQVAAGRLRLQERNPGEEE